MDIKVIAKDILLKNINLEGIAFDLVDSVLEEALKKLVADTSNPLDDALFAAIYPSLEKSLKELLHEKIEELKK